MRKGQWCTSDLKAKVIKRISEGNFRGYFLSHTEKKTFCENVRRNDNRISSQNLPLVQQQTKSKSLNANGFSLSPRVRGADINIVQYLGIAADETERIKRHTRDGFVLPLVDIGWDEAYCRKWCEENDLLSPIYTDATRGGCWFCHNQSIDQLRLLRKNYPEYWRLLMKWDKDSPVSFHTDGKTVHDFEKRFSMEDSGIVPTGTKFRWKMLETKQSEWLDFLLKED